MQKDNCYGIASHIYIHIQIPSLTRVWHTATHQILNVAGCASSFRPSIPGAILRCCPPIRHALRPYHLAESNRGLLLVELGSSHIKAPRSAKTFVKNVGKMTFISASFQETQDTHPIFDPSHSVSSLSCRSRRPITRLFYLAFSIPQLVAVQYLPTMLVPSPCIALTFWAYLDG